MTYVNTCAEREHLGRGRYRHVQHIKPVAFDDGGTLRAIDSRWADSGISARPHIVTASRLITSVADDGMRRIHPTREADRYLEIGAPYVKVGGVWRKVGFQGATRDGNRITWHRPQADLTITHGGHFAKLDIALLGGYVPEDGLVAFPVGINGLTRQGGQILAGGVPVMRLRAPVVTDADDPLDVRAIDGQFVSLAGQPYYVMTLPSLVGMSRPVIDPTLEIQPDAAAGADVGLYYWDGYYSDKNYGVRTDFIFTTDDGLIRFSLTGIPSAATCSSAKLTFYKSNAPGYNGDYNATIHAVLGANGDWIEGVGNGALALAGEPCWNAKMADGAGGISVAWAGDSGANGGADAGCSVAGTDYAVAVLATATLNPSDAQWTPYELSFVSLTEVQSWFGTDAVNYGLKVRSPGIFGALVALASSDHATAGYRPKLTIEYSEPTKQVFY